MSRRTLKIASVIRTVLAEEIRGRLDDPRIEPLTSITHVDVSADMSEARVYVSVMAPEARQKLTLKALCHAAGRMRTLIARTLSVRQAPLLTFYLDESLQKGFETVRQIDAIMDELDGPRDESEPEGPADRPADHPAPCDAGQEEN